MSIPKDAREVYLNEKGEPIAFCPVDSIGLTDLHRAEFYGLNEERLAQLAEKARVKSVETSVAYSVVCIDVDDKTWTPLVDALMPNHDWEQYRSRGERPVARGIVPRYLLADTIKSMYPAAGKLTADAINICVFAAGGIAVIPHKQKA